MIKKIYCLLVILSFASTVLFAQKSLYIGPVAGFGSSRVTGTAYPSTDGYFRATHIFHPSYVFGGNLVYFRDARFAFGGALLFEFAGNKLKVVQDVRATKYAPPVWDRFDFSHDLTMVRIPLTVYYYLTKPSHTIRTFIHFGPSFGFIASIRESKPSGYSVIPSKLDNVFNTSFDLGIQAGIGVGFPIGKNCRLHTALDLYQGVKDIMMNRWYFNDNRYNTNEMIRLEVGALFKL